MLFQNGTSLDINNNPPNLNDTQKNFLRRNASDFNRKSTNQQKMG